MTKVYLPEKKPVMTRRKVSALACVLTLGSVSASSGCVGSDSANRARVLASPAARRLAGEWKASFWLDRSGAIARSGAEASPVNGTIVFVEDSQGPVSTDELTGPTHDGAYDIDFSRFGFTTRSSGEFPAAVARIADLVTIENNSPLRDSLQIILSPGTELFVVRMTGEMRDDSIAGGWSASTYRADAGSGHFIMRRQSR